MYHLRSLAALYGLTLFLSACTGFERSQREAIRKQNAQGEYIHRNAAEVFAPIGTPQHTPRNAYPWETEAKLPRITHEFFRCKCRDRHGLPLIHGHEGVYPVLVDLLNFLQRETGHRVVVTSGHRCPTYNTAADGSKENQTSKHQIGAEVDFYVLGLEERPFEVVELVQKYYRGKGELSKFARYEKGDAHVRTQPWLNKEIFLKVYLKDEGRDADNQHPYPYLSLQVRFDPQTGERVVYSWEKASKGYSR